MFDHVGVAVSDLAASERFYRTVLSALGLEPSYAGSDMVGWDDWWIGPADSEHRATRGLHVGFRAPDRAAVDAFWQAGIDAGHPDDGAPGPRTVYGPDYYGGFLLDPDGNSAEAVHSERANPVPPGQIDHLSIRVVDEREGEVGAGEPHAIRRVVGEAELGIRRDRRVEAPRRLRVADAEP